MSSYTPPWDGYVWTVKTAATQLGRGTPGPATDSARKFMESSYEEIAAKAMEAGPYDGVLLRYTNNYAVAVCQACGELPTTWRHGWTSDWMTLCSQAMDHSKDTGHFTAVTLSHWAIYGPDAEKKGEMEDDT